MDFSPTVLVVDDEPQVRGLTCRILRADDCAVVEADDGETALAAVARDDPRLDLILTDLTMPRLSGIAVLGAVRVHRPDLPVVVMSGVVPDDRVREALKEYRAPLITKPFSPHDLTWVVRETLETARHDVVQQSREVRAQSLQTRAESVQIRTRSAGLRADARGLLATARAVQAQLFGGAPEVTSA